MKIRCYSQFPVTKKKKKKEYIVEYLRKNLTHSHFHTIIIFSVEISHNITHTFKIVIIETHNDTMFTFHYTHKK